MHLFLSLPSPLHVPFLPTFVSPFSPLLFFFTFFISVTPSTLTPSVRFYRVHFNAMHRNKKRVEKRGRAQQRQIAQHRGWQQIVYARVNARSLAEWRGGDGSQRMDVERTVSPRLGTVRFSSVRSSLGINQLCLSVFHRAGGELISFSLNTNSLFLFRGKNLFRLKWRARFAFCRIIKGCSSPPAHHHLPRCSNTARFYPLTALRMQPRYRYNHPLTLPAVPSYA